MLVAFFFLFVIGNNRGYNFCVFNYLRFEIDRKNKQGIDYRKKFTDVR